MLLVTGVSDDPLVEPGCALRGARGVESVLVFDGVVVIAAPPGEALVPEEGVEAVALRAADVGRLIDPKRLLNPPIWPTPPNN